MHNFREICRNIIVIRLIKLRREKLLKMYSNNEKIFNPYDSYSMVKINGNLNTHS